MLGATVDSPKEFPSEVLKEFPKEFPKELPNALLLARGDDDPTLCLRPPLAPQSFETTLWKSGLDAGEKGPDETRRPDSPGVADNGEEGLPPAALAGLPLREVDTRYRGGVT